MIKIIKTSKETHSRDKKRNRFLLVLSKNKWCITEEEAFNLYFQTTDQLTQAGLINTNG